MGAGVYIFLGLFYIIYYGFFYPSSRKNSSGGSKVAYADYYSAYAGKRGYISTNDLEHGIKLSASYDKEVPFVAEFAHTTINFQFQPELAKEGKPVGVIENSIEKIVSLKDNVMFQKGEFFNDQIEFKGFELKFGNTDMSTYIRIPHVESTYQDNGIFYSDAKTAFFKQTLHTPGATMRVKMSKVFKDAKYFTTVYFHEGHPQEEKVITFNIPEWLEVEILERNFEGYQIVKTAEAFTPGDKISTSEDSEEETDAPKSKQKAKKEKDKLKHVTYTIKNMKAGKDEELAAGPSRNLPHLVVLCKKYDKTKAKKDFDAKAKAQKSEDAANQKKKPNKSQPVAAKDKKKVKPKAVTPKTELVNNLADLYAWYAEIVAMSDNDTTVVAPKAQQLVKDLNSDEEKLKAIFYWVQDNIRYVAFEDGLAAFKPDACQNVYNNRYGDCKGMANLLKNMLKSVGYDARLTWIGTKRIAYDYHIPSVIVDNHMICTVFLNGKRYFLDGTESYIGLDDYAHRIQGRPVLIENGKEFLIDTIPDLPVDRNIHSRTATFQVVNDKLIGKMAERISGENKTNLLRRNSYTALADKEKMLLDYLNDDKAGIEVAEVTTSDLTDREKDAELNYTITYTNAAFSNANSIYFKADNVNEFGNHNIDTSRITDVTYSHKLNFHHQYTFVVPDGYRIEYLPQTLNVDNEEFNFVVQYSSNGNQITYTKKLQLKTGYISKRNFSAWNKAIEQLNAAYKEYVILKK